MTVDKNETGKDIDQFDVVVSWLYPQIDILYNMVFFLIN